MKARLTARGDQDPELLSLVRNQQTSAPTVSTNGKVFTLQVIAFSGLMWSLETSPEHSWNQRNCVNKWVNFSFVSHPAAFQGCTLNNSWKYVYHCMGWTTARRGGSWKSPLSFGTSGGNLLLWMSASSCSVIRIPRSWQGYCVYTYMTCCWVAVAQPIVKQSKHSVHVSRSANGQEIKDNSVVAPFPWMFSLKRSLCLRVLTL